MGGTFERPARDGLAESVELHGAQAIARWDIPDVHGAAEETDYVTLAKLDGHWLVDSFPDDDDPDAPPIWAAES